MQGRSHACGVLRLSVAAQEQRFFGLVHTCKSGSIFLFWNEYIFIENNKNNNTQNFEKDNI